MTIEDDARAAVEAELDRLRERFGDFSVERTRLTETKGARGSRVMVRESEAARLQAIPKESLRQKEPSTLLRITKGA